MKKFTLSIIAMVCAVFAMNAELYIVGDMNSWNFQKMDEPEPNVYTWTGDFHAGNTFKFPLESGKWAPCYTPKWEQGVGPETNETVNSGESYTIYLKNADAWPDNKFVMAQEGNYTVTVNLNDYTMVCTLNQNVAVLPDLYIVGGDTPAGWNTQDGQSWKMTRDGNTYSLTVFLTKNTDETRFVFLTGTEWWPRYISATAGNAPLENIETGVEYPLTKATGNMNSAGFTVKDTGIYKITITLADEDSGVMKLEHAPLSIVGPAMNGWDLGSAPSLDSNSDGSYTFTGDFNEGEFRINAKGDWWPSFIFVDNTPVTADGGTYPVKFATNGASPSFAEAGNYTLNLTFADSKPVLTVTHNEKAITELYIVGNALNGIEGVWSLNDEYRKAMESTDTEGEFRWAGHLHEGQFKFLLNADKWNPGIVATEEDQPVYVDNNYPMVSSVGHNDYKFIIPEEGDYTILANTSNMTLSVLKGGIPTGVGTVAADGAFSIFGRTLTASGSVEVYTTLGARIATMNGGSTTLPSAGIYVVVSAGKVAKVAVK